MTIEVIISLKNGKAPYIAYINKGNNGKIGKTIEVWTTPQQFERINDVLNPTNLLPFEEIRTTTFMDAFHSIYGNEGYGTTHFTLRTESNNYTMAKKRASQSIDKHFQKYIIKWGNDDE